MSEERGTILQKFIQKVENKYKVYEGVWGEGGSKLTQLFSRPMLRQSKCVQGMAELLLLPASKVQQSICKKLINTFLAA